MSTTPTETPEERTLRETNEKLKALEIKAEADNAKAEKNRKFAVIAAIIIVIGGVFYFMNNEKKNAIAEAEKAKAVEAAEKAVSDAEVKAEKAKTDAEAKAAADKVTADAAIAAVKAEADKAVAEAKVEAERKLAEAKSEADRKIAESEQRMMQQMQKMTANVAPVPVAGPTEVSPRTPMSFGPASAASRGPVTDQELRQLKKLVNIEGETLICGHIPAEPGPVRLPDGRMALVYPLFVDESMTTMCQIGLHDQHIEGARESIRFSGMASEPDRNTIEVVRIVEDPQTGNKYGQLGIIAQIQGQTQQGR